MSYKGVACGQASIGWKYERHHFHDILNPVSVVAEFSEDSRSVRSAAYRRAETYHSHEKAVWETGSTGVMLSNKKNQLLEVRSWMDYE